MTDKYITTLLIIGSFTLFNIYIAFPVFREIREIDNYVNATCTVTENQYNIYDRKYKLIVGIEDKERNETDIFIIQFDSLNELKEGAEKYHKGYEFRCIYYPDWDSHNSIQGHTQTEHLYELTLSVIVMFYIAVICLTSYQIILIYKHRNRNGMNNPYVYEDILQT